MTLASSPRLDRRQVGLVLAGLFCAAVGVVAIASLVLTPDPADTFDAILVYGVLLYAFLGVVVLWRRPGHGIGRLALAIALSLAVGLLLSVILRYGPPTEGVRTILDWPLQVAIDVSSLLSNLLLAAGVLLSASLLLVWFPDGHRTSRLGRLIEITLVLSVLALFVSSLKDPILRQIGWSAAKESVFDAAFVVGLTGILFAYLGAWIDLGLRYGHADDTRRTQMRWVWWAEGVSLACGVALAVGGDRFEWLGSLWFVSLGLPAVAIAIAISRYRLYEIDRIVSRTIAYALVSAILFAVFAATIIVLQRVIAGAAAQGTEPEPGVVAVSTLAVAALFNPLRVRVHRQVDHRFHRARYDSAAMVAGFSERLRDELDLPTVTNDLVTTAARALEPTSGVIWLRARPDRV